MRTSSGTTHGWQTNGDQNVILLDEALLARLHAMAEADRKAVPAICAAVSYARRKVADISQEEAARRIGMSLNGYRAYETKREPSLRRLRQIAAAFGLEEDYFQTFDVAETARDAELNERLERVEETLGQLSKKFNDLDRKIDLALEAPDLKAGAEDAAALIARGTPDEQLAQEHEATPSSAPARSAKQRSGRGRS